MSKTTAETQLLELLPGSLQGDADVSAMAQAVQPQLDDINSHIPLLELYSRLDELPDSLLHMLAWENKMAGAEWALTVTHDDRVNLVRNSYELNKRRGTRWAVERIFTLLRFRPTIVEWWEETPKATPHTFKISVLDVAERGLTLEQLGLIEQLIYAYKPLRSWLTELGLTLSTDSDTKALAAITQYGVLDIGPMSQGAQSVDFDYTAYNKGAVTLTGVLDVMRMQHGHEVFEHGAVFGTIQAMTAQGVLNVGPRLNSDEPEAVATAAAATYIKLTME